MTKKDYVSLKTAKELKDKGFNEECIAYYCNENLCYVIPLYGGDIIDILMSSKKLPRDFILAPTLYQAQKWLRDNYNCYIQVTHEPYKTKVNHLVQVLFYDKSSDDGWSDKSSGLYGDNGEFETYEDALNFGILEALKRFN